MYKIKIPPDTFLLVKSLLEGGDTADIGRIYIDGLSYNCQIRKKGECRNWETVHFTVKIPNSDATCTFFLSDYVFDDCYNPRYATGEHVVCLHINGRRHTYNILVIGDEITFRNHRERYDSEYDRHQLWYDNLK